MPHSIINGKYHTKRICSRCGYILGEEETLYDHQKATGHQNTAIIDVDEKISEVISILISKGYFVKSHCQGGYPDYYRETQVEGGNARVEETTVTEEEKKEIRPKHFYIEFRMNPSSLKQFNRTMSQKAIDIYAEKYWEWIGNMIETLPNAFEAEFVYSTKIGTEPRSIIRTARQKPRDLKIVWIICMNPRRLGSIEEFETMVQYGYRKLLEWAQALPDINEYINSIGD